MRIFQHELPCNLHQASTPGFDHPIRSTPSYLALWARISNLQIPISKQISMLKKLFKIAESISSMAKDISVKTPNKKVENNYGVQSSEQDKNVREHFKDILLNQ